MKETIIKFENFGFQYKVKQNPQLYDKNLYIHKGEKDIILSANGLIPF